MNFLLYHHVSLHTLIVSYMYYMYFQFQHESNPPILQYRVVVRSSSSSLSPSTSIISPPNNASLRLQALGDFTPRRHSIPTSLAPVLTTVLYS